MLYFVVSNPFYSHLLDIQIVAEEPVLGFLGLKHQYMEYVLNIAGIFGFCLMCSSIQSLPRPPVQTQCKPRKSIETFV